MVYLLACSGLSDKNVLEAQASEATRLARKDRLSDREAVVAVLAQVRAGVSASELKGC